MALDDVSAEAPIDPANALSGFEPITASDRRQPDKVEKLRRWADPRATINICDDLIADQQFGEQWLHQLGMTCYFQYQIDQQSRAGWLARTRAAMDLAMQVVKTKTFPWPNASNVIYPLISIAAIQFQARAYPQLIDGPKVVKASVVGKDDGVPLLDPKGAPVIGQDGQPLWEQRPGDKQKRADRISGHMSWQYLHEQPEWEAETDQMCIILPIVGCTFRKTIFDHDEKRNGSALILAQNMVINYKARSLEAAARLTEELEFTPVEIEEAIRSKSFLRHDVGVAPGADGDVDAGREYIEQHRRMDLDGDGYPEPYKVTIKKDTQKVVRISSRFDPEGIMLSGVDKTVLKITAVQEITQYNFLPNPDGGVYGVGLGQLLGPINHSVNTTLNQLFDAGTVANLGGGFVGRGLGLKAGSMRFSPGEYKMVNAIGATVRDSIVPLTFPGPSDVLFKLLGFLVEASRELSSNSEVLSGNQSRSNQPATTTLALIEQGMKVFSAVFKRIYRSLSSEYRKQARLNRIYLDPESGFMQQDEWKVIYQRDYQLGGTSVIPVADPNMVSDTQRLVRAEALKEFLPHPKVDSEKVLLEIFKAMKLDDPEGFIVPEQPDPTIKLKAIELALRNIEVRSKALVNLANAAKAMAETDAIVHEQMISWINVNMGSLRFQMDALSNLEGQANQDAGLPAIPPPGGAEQPGAEQAAA